MTPIDVELLRNALGGVVDEMYIALMKSAYSTNIKERRDHSTAIFDARGRIVVQGESLPLHLASMLGLVEIILARHGREGLCPEDMFISNDRFVGRGSHLPDVAMAAPVFHDRTLIGFVANTTASFSGTGPDGRYYVYLETIGGGIGARAYADGADGVQAHLTNTSNLPVEVLEQEYPLLIERYELRADSGGAGRFRGGLGLRREYRPLGHAMRFSGQGERMTHSPWGVFGGKEGARGALKRRDEDGRYQLLPGKPSSIAVSPGETILVETPGAGGYGPACERSDEELRSDEIGQKFSPAYIEKNYG